MSDSSEDDVPLNLRAEAASETDDEYPRKRQKTMKTLRGRGVGFVKSTVEEDEDDDMEDERPSFGAFRSGPSRSAAGREEEDELEDERPSFGAFRGGFNLGEYNTEVDSDPPSRQETPRRSPPPVIRPSAFGSSGNAAKMSFAARQMAKMGYVEGKGLGVKGEGIAAPIVAKGTTGRIGLGMGSKPDDVKKKRPERVRSQPSTPGSRTPVPKPRPKPKYQTVADIEAGGLRVPATLRSIIIDATGSEHRTVSSPAGFATPTRERSPARETSKIAQRAKRDLEEYANAWNAAKENEAHLKAEEQRLQAEIEMTEQSISKLQSVVSAFEITSLNDSTAAGDSTKTEWDQVVERLQTMQNSYAEFIEELDLPEATAAVLETPFKREMSEWNPIADPDHLVESIQGLGPLLELEKGGRRSTPFHSLLSLHWFPQIRRALRETWDVYNPIPAINLISVWKAIIPPWMYCRIIDELVMPQLIATIDSFKVVSKIKSKKTSTPPLHAWLFDWWSLLSKDDFNTSVLATLATHIKSKLDSESWPTWKPLLSRPKEPLAPAPQATTISDEESSPSSEPEISFADQVEYWAIENGLILTALHRPNAEGWPLYRLKPEDKAGVVVSMYHGVVFDARGDRPYGLDDGLANFARSRA